MNTIKKQRGFIVRYRVNMSDKEALRLLMGIVIIVVMIFASVVTAVLLKETHFWLGITIAGVGMAGAWPLGLWYALRKP